MLFNIIKSQILEHLYGIKFIITFVIITVLMIGTTVTGLVRYESQLEAATQIRSNNEHSLLEAGSWRSISHEGVKLTKPAAKLGVFASGLEDSVGRTATVKDGDFPQMEDSIYSTAPIFAVFGDLDVTFIIKIVISLFAILFTYDIISGEKERGTLKLCLSNSIPRNTFMLGKSIGSFISLLIPLIIPLLVSILILLISGVEFQGDEWSRLGVIILGYILYLLSFFSLGIFVSTATKQSAVSFLILLFIWVVFVLVIPKGAMMVANQIYPIESVNEVRAQQYQKRRDFNDQLWDLTSQEYQRQGLNLDGPARWMKIREIRNSLRDELEPAFDRDYRKIIDDFKRDQGNLTRLAINLSRISPASAVTYIGMNMSGTGFQEQESFLGQLGSQRKVFQDLIDREIEKENNQRMSRGFGGHGTAEQGQIDLSPISPVMDYKYERLSVSESLMLVLPDIVALILISIVFYLLAFIFFIRYDVR